jgi:uncharacterized protein YqeY
MTLIAEIKEQLESAMRDGDAPRRDALRLILSSLQGAEKELQRQLHEDEELQVLQRERKKRLEAADAFRSAGAALGGGPRGDRRRRHRRGGRHEHA